MCRKNTFISTLGLNSFYKLRSNERLCRWKSNDESFFHRDDISANVGMSIEPAISDIIYIAIFQNLPLCVKPTLLASDW